MIWPTIPPGVEPWQYYLLVGAAVVVVGIAKAGFGGGVGILAIPLMTLGMGPERMLGVMLPLLIACDLVSNAMHFGHYDWKRLRPLLLGLALGVGLGTAALWALGDMPPDQFRRAISVVVGVVCLGVVLMQAYRLTGRELSMPKPRPINAVGVGAFAGGVSTINHSAGPIVTIYLLQAKLPKRTLVGTLLAYFLIGNTLKLPTYCLLPMADGEPLINADTLRDSVWFIPLIPVGAFMGLWMHHRVPEKPFEAILYIFAGITAAYILYKALV